MCGSFAILDNPDCESFANFFERADEFRVIATARLRDRSRAGSAIRQHQQCVIRGTVAIDGNAVERARDNLAQRAIEHAWRDGRVGNDE